MRPLTNAMKASLMQSYNGTVRCSHSTMQGLRQRNLCGGAHGEGGDVWTSTLSILGRSERRRLLLEAGPATALKIARAARQGRVASHPQERLRLAKGEALEGASLAKGAKLTGPETEMVVEAFERAIDVLEAGTRRLLICRHGDTILGSQEGELSRCPKHDSASRVGPFGLDGALTKTAVVFDPVPVR